MRIFLTTILTAALAAAAALPGAAAPKTNPIVIAHRGASGHRPEHTLAAYKLAIEMGADFIEPDLVSTKDGHLVARHENKISETTDVASRPEFASRKTTKRIDDEKAATDWFVEDFTLAELKTLRARERLPEVRPGNTVYDGRFEIPTLQEIIDLVKREGRRRGREVGIYPETKHPSYFDSIGLSLEEPLVETLRRNGYRDKTSPVFIQSFEVGNLKELSRMTSLPLVQLLYDEGKPFDFTLKGDPRTYADMMTPAGLAEIATYARGVGVPKNLILSLDTNGRLLAPTRLVEDAHRNGLLVHVYTFRSENPSLPAHLRRGAQAKPNSSDRRGDAAAEYGLFFRLKVDGVFSDHPGDALSARKAYYRKYLKGRRRIPG